MITLIHGEDTLASRNYYFAFKQTSQDSLTLAGATILPTDLQQAISGEDLFGNKKTIFIEELFSKRKSSKDIENLADILNVTDADVVLWESKELTAKQVGLIKKVTAKLFKIPSTIFALLDSLKPGNGKQLVEQFHATLVDKDAEFVLVMLQRQVRILLALNYSSNEVRSSQTSSSNNITEVSRLAPWQKGKLEKQAQLFSTNILVLLHEKLFQLELGMKTGGLSLPLDKEIDLLLLSV